MTDNKKDIIIQVEITSDIYTKIDELKKKLAELSSSAGTIPVTIDTSAIKKQDWSKLVPQGGANVNIRSSIDKGFHLNIKNVKQALKSLHANATVPIKIVPLADDALSSIKNIDWAKLSPPKDLAENIKSLNSALSTLGSRLGSRKFGKGDAATTKSLAQIINETADAFDRMSASAAAAAGSVGAIKTHGIASDPTKARGGKGKGGKEFDISTFSHDEQAFYNTQARLIGDNSRQLENLQKFMAGNAALRQKIALTGKAGENNISGMMDMGGLKGAMSRVLLFGSATSVLYGGISSLRTAIDVTIDLENEMVQLKKVMNDTTPFEEMKAQMFSLSEAMGVSILQVTKLAKIWAQQGYDMVGVMKLATVTLDTMNALSVDAGVATDFLTSVTRVWGVELDQLQKILASVMRVQADYAIESEDLAVILTRIGSGVREAGDSMAFLSGASTALRESTRKTASQIFTSLKTIYAKSFSIEVIKALENVGIYAKSSADTFRPFSDILTELAGKWETLSDVERKSLAITIGQTRYWSDFVALMENFGTVQSATLSFYRAWDDASKASQLQQQSLLNTLKSVGSSFAKIGDTFGVKFFTPLVQAMAGPIKAFADFFSKLGGAQSALVFAASLAILRSALTSVFGVFPAYQKFLGRSGLAGIQFTSAVRGMTQSMIHLSRGVGIGNKALLGFATATSVVTGGSVKAGYALKGLATAFVRIAAISKVAWASILGFFKSLGSFALWTLAFYAADKIISKIADSFKSAKTEAEEFAEAFPTDVLEKINSLGTKDKKTGLGVTSFSEIKSAMDELIPLLVKRQKELTTSTKEYTLSWKEVQEVINSMSSNEVAILMRNYKDLTTNVETQKKFWEDIQTTMAIIENFTFGDTKKKAEELKISASQDFVKASTSASRVRKELSNITGLKLENADDLYGEEFQKAIFKNIKAIAKNPILKKAIEDLDVSLKGDNGVLTAFTSKLGVFEGMVDFGKLDQESKSFKAITDGLAERVMFDLLDVQDQVTKFQDSHPLDLRKGMTIADIPVDQLFDASLVSFKSTAGQEKIRNLIDESFNSISKMGDNNKLKKPSTTGFKVDLGKLFTEPSQKAQKALAALNGELDKIELLFRAGGIFPEDVLQEQQKAYKNFLNEIVSEYAGAKRELEYLTKKEADIIALIMADPSSATELKQFDASKKSFEQFITDLETVYNSAATGAGDEAAKDNHVLASNLRELKATLVAQREAQLSLQVLAKSYNELGPVINILGKINYQLEQQSVIEKMIKNNREFTAKQSVDFLKSESQMYEDIAKSRISAEQAMLEAQGNQYKKIEELKLKELALHRSVAVKKTEIDIIEQKKSLQNNTKILPFMIPIKGFAGIAKLWNQTQEKRKTDLDLNIEQLDEQGEIMKTLVNLQEDMFASSSGIAQFYSIWIEHLNSVAERSSFIKGVLADSITDFSRINETHGLSVLTDTIGKIGKRFQEEQAKIFVSSVINSKLGAFVLPSEEDIKFTERLAATSTVFYNSVYGAMHAGAIEIAQVMGAPFPVPPQSMFDRAKAEKEAAELGNVKKAGNIAAIGNLASMIGLSFIGGNDAGKQRGSEIGSVLGAVLPKLLFGANPVVGAISSVVGLFGGGVLGSLFGGKAEKQQDTMIGQLKLIEQNTARVADLTEKLVNIPGSVFLPPTGGFVMNGSIVINANGITNPQEVVDRTVSQLTREFGLSARRSGSRGYF